MVEVLEFLGRKAEFPESRTDCGNRRMERRKD